MLRSIEKKNWRSYIESCWEVANKVSQCVEMSPQLATIKDENLRSNLVFASGKSFISAYIRHWINDEQNTIDYPQVYKRINTAIQLQDSNSSLFDANRESLEALNSECNFLSLGECCREKFTLENMEGDYEFFAQTLKK